MPILVVLRDFAGWLPATVKKAEPRHLWDFISHRLDTQNLGFAAEPLQKALEDGRALVLLDGLDEIPTAKQRRLSRDAVVVFAQRYARCRLAVTCRTLSYQDKDWQLEGFPAFELAPFDDKKIARFIEAWYAELGRLGVVKSQEAGGLAQRLKQALQRPDLRRLAPNPLLLTVMALVHTHKGRLPEARALLYEETVEILLWRWEQLKAGDVGESPRLRQLLAEAGRADVDLRRALWRLAFEAHQQAGDAESEAVADIGELHLEKTLAALHPDRSRDWAQQVIAAMKMRAGLLLERTNEVYTFPHRTFQEYLAGAHLATQAGFAQRASQLLEQGAFWREVVLLAVGRLVYLAGDIDKPLALVAKLCPTKKVANDLGWRKAWLAGEALLEMGVNRVQDDEFGQELAERVRRRLVDSLAGSHLRPVERAAAGNALARLGDPRFREDAWFLPDEELLGFVEIPAGSFKMGEDNEMHEFILPAYYLGRFPVTVAQFRAFVAATKYKPRNPDCLHGVANHPVVYITWYEALKYCDWLTEALREWEGTPPSLRRLLREKHWRVTLPSEAEWEKAARGTDGRVYPWGDDPDPNKASYDDTGIGTTSAVGCFPAGASQSYGCQDMSGNVWEWTRSLWGKYPYPNDNREQAERENLKASDDRHRVVRGGSFNGYHRLVRCAARGGDLPGVRYWYYGFRVALRPFL